MSGWGPWDWIAWAGLGLAVFFLAANTAILSLPAVRRSAPRRLKHHYWGFVPLFFFSVSSVIFGFEQLGWLGKNQASSQYFFEFRPTIPTMVTGKTFRNERVLLDNMDYVDCKFYNVTFVYNGTGPVHLRHNDFDGIWLVSDNKAVMGAFYILRGVGFIKDGIPFDLPSGTNVEPPAITH